MLIYKYSKIFRPAVLTKLYRNTIMMKVKLRWTVIPTPFQSKCSIFFHFLILSEHFGTIRLRILQCEFFSSDGYW